MEEAGLCAWIVSSKNGNQWIEGGGLVTGEKCDQGLYRSESWGQLGVLAFLELISLPNAVYFIKIACDELGLDLLHIAQIIGSLYKQQPKNWNISFVEHSILEFSKQG